MIKHIKAHIISDFYSIYSDEILFILILILFILILMKKLKVGITGGIGSGKTTVCHIFETLGIPVYYADDRAKALMIKEGNLKNKIRNGIGKYLVREVGKEFINQSFLQIIYCYSKMPAILVAHLHIV